MKKLFVLLSLSIVHYQLSIAQNIGIGTTNPQAQLHTTGSVRHDILKGSGSRLVFVNDSGNLAAKQVTSNEATYNIPDNTCSGVFSPITISDMPNAISSSLIRVKIDISHIFDQDLSIYLISPLGQVLVLANANGSNSDNFTNTVFADNAPTSISAGNAPFIGSYKPLGATTTSCLNTSITSFAGFGGGTIVPNGTWTLKVVDNSSGDTGTINSWAITFNGSEPSFGTIPVNVVPRGGADGFLIRGNIYDNGKIGIGTQNPVEMLHVADSNVVFAAQGDIPGNYGGLHIKGQGRRMIWYAGIGAFRAGYVSGANWNQDSIGAYSFASGNDTKATGEASMAMGVSTVSSGYSSRALGYYTIASGNYSTALGAFASTNGKTGSFAIGDYSSFTKVNTTLLNQMVMRFVNGYTLYTNATLTAGVTLTSGGGSWSSVSDRRKKENFRTINGEELLQKVAALPVTNWNYKSQPATQRHIGPMAQDFYAAFHLDGEGADTTINTMDISGVNMAAIQALNAKCKMQNEQLEAVIAANEKLTMENARLTDGQTKLENAVANLQKQMKELQRILQPKTAQK